MVSEFISTFHTMQPKSTTGDFNVPPNMHLFLLVDIILSRSFVEIFRFCTTNIVLDTVRVVNHENLDEM